jgi:hypothetical protein
LFSRSICGLSKGVYVNAELPPKLQRDAPQSDETAARLYLSPLSGEL